jgi:hypothetical protein
MDVKVPTTMDEDVGDVSGWNVQMLSIFYEIHALEDDTIEHSFTCTTNYMPIKKLKHMTHKWG